MLLNILSREGEDGCAALKKLIDDSHETDVNKRKHEQHAFKLFRGLVESKVMSIIPPAKRNHPGEKLKLNMELPEDFSLNQSLGLWLLSVITLLDKEAVDYSLQLLSCVEAVLEDPQIILRAQTKHQRDLLFQRLKDEGVGYEERMERLEKAEYPMPGKDFIYDTYNDFILKNPWLKEHSIRPKSIVREMFEDYTDFPDYIRTYKLERTEGVLLRHLSEVYKVLTQTVPDTAKTEEVREAEEFIHEILENTDSSLLDEWKTLNDPSYDPEAEREAKLAERQEVPLTRRKGEFSALVHHSVLSFLKAFRDERWEDCFTMIQPATSNDERWEQVDFEDTIDDYLDEFEPYRLDPEARNKKHHHVRENERTLYITQTLCDPDLKLVWSAYFVINLDKTDEVKKVHLTFDGFGKRFL